MNVDASDLLPNELGILSTNSKLARVQRVVLQREKDGVAGRDGTGREIRASRMGVREGFYPGCETIDIIDAVLRAVGRSMKGHITCRRLHQSMPVQKQ